MSADSRPSGYTLVVCEKPDAARRVAEALSGGRAPASVLDGVTIFRFSADGEDFVVCSAQGHVYAVSDPFGERWVYPVFDTEWYPTNLVVKENTNMGRRIAAIRKLSEGADKFVNACDFDFEGETIGFNVLRYACAGREKRALRAKFSTLTKEELVEAFRGAKPTTGEGLARAGRARHAIDFVWGINLSRVLSQSALSSGRRYRTVSIGRVQGPTLNFVVERENEIQGFVPVPFWNVVGVFKKDGEVFTAAYSKEKLDRQEDARRVSNDCSGKEGVVTAVRKSVVSIRPYPPPNIGDLQKEAYRAFGFSPSRTLQIAERLYLGALISYPRTGSQKLPPSLNYRGILQGLAALPEYSKEATELLRGELRPVEGDKTDPAHPAIHPTGERPKGPLDSSEFKVYDLVVRRFLSVFAPSAKRETVALTIGVEGHEFKLVGGRTVFPGWMAFYGRYRGPKDVEVPPLVEGNRLAVVEVKSEEVFESKPVRYNQASLLEKMEKERIGTKATRADVIATLVERSYVSGTSLAPTELGFSVIETMRRFAPSIITTELTRDIEERLDAVERGTEEDRSLVREAIKSVSEQLVGLNSNEEEVGKEIDAALAATVAASYVLGDCPICKTGKLRLIRSKKTGKRFLGCTNYASGCRASAPLPQRGTIKAAANPCQHCSWPVVYVVTGRRPWRLCVNPGCPSKGGRRE